MTEVIDAPSDSREGTAMEAFLRVQLQQSADLTLDRLQACRRAQFQLAAAISAYDEALQRLATTTAIDSECQATAAAARLAATRLRACRTRAVRQAQRLRKISVRLDRMKLACVDPNFSLELVDEMSDAVIDSLGTLKDVSLADAISKTNSFFKDGWRKVVGVANQAGHAQADHPQGPDHPQTALPLAENQSPASSGAPASDDGGDAPETGSSNTAEPAVEQGPVVEGMDQAAPIIEPPPPEVPINKST